MLRTATEGQSWFMNALGYEVTMEMCENRDSCDTHIDILIDKLKEECVYNVIELIFSFVIL